MAYNKEEVDSKFNEGKDFLDRGSYEKGITNFDELINLSEKYPDNEDAELTLHISLNNRGVARCQLAKQKRDKELYKKGMEDYKRAIESYHKVDDRRMLTACNNLKHAEKEFIDFENAKPDNIFHSFFQ